jgi:hypothetical protein
MKAYTTKQVEKALTNNGFECFGGNSGIEFIGNYEFFNDVAYNSRFSFKNRIFAVVENGRIKGIDCATINGEHPQIWFNSIKSELS